MRSDALPLTAATSLAGLRALEHARRQRFIEEFDTECVEAKLLSLGIAESRLDAAQLMLEAKRYLLLYQAAGPLTMYSALVDAAWHQFVLATELYTQFCVEGWGGYLHHDPGGEPDPQAAHARSERGDSFDCFKHTYEEFFGPLPDVWYDERCLRDNLRLIRPSLRDEFFVEDASPNRVALVRERGVRQVVCLTNRRMRPALECIARHRTLLVREVIGARDAAERTLLLAPLVQFGVLQLAP